MSVFLAKCRHNPTAPAGICELQPGVVVCPCLGPSREFAGRLSVDDAGQIVWTALGINNEAKAHHTFVALRRGADGRVSPVALARSESVTPNVAQGCFPFALRNDPVGVTVFIRVDELMARAIAGDEFVEIPA